MATHSYYGSIYALLGVFIGLLVYLLPTIIAGRRKHLKRNMIFLLNLLLGWSVVGWIVALSLACMGEKWDIKQFFKIFLIIIGGIAVISVAITEITYIVMSPVRDEAKAFTGSIITDFTRNWDWNVLNAHGDAHWKAATKGKDMNKLGADLKAQLGKLQSIQDSDCSINVNFSDGKHTYAQCYANAIFEKDNAAITLTMEKNLNDWQIMGINFNRTYTKK